MGVITVLVGMLKGEQQSTDSAESSAGKFRGKVTEKPLQPQEELLRAMTEAAEMFRDNHIAPMSAGGALKYTLKKIVAYVPGPYLTKIAFAKQTPAVRRANALTTLKPIFVEHAYIDISQLADWSIRAEPDSAAGIDDGCSDAFVAHPHSGIEVKFAFDGDFVDQSMVTADSTRPQSVQPNPNVIGSATPATIKYRVRDDHGREIESGVISSFPTTMGRDHSDINVPGHLTKVSGKHIELLLTPQGQVAIRHLSEKRGTWLVQGARATQVTSIMPLPRDGKLILGDATIGVTGTAVVEFTNLSQTNVHDATDFATHQQTELAPEPSTKSTTTKPTATVYARGGASPTRLAPRPTISQGRYGILVLKYSNGEEDIQPIDKLPFTIGRAPDQNAAIRETCEFASRKHVQIEDVVQNGLAARILEGVPNPSFLGSEPQTNSFIWSFCNPNDPDALWLKLGGESLTAETVWAQIRQGNVQ